MPKTTPNILDNIELSHERRAALARAHLPVDHPDAAPLVPIPVSAAARALAESLAPIPTPALVTGETDATTLGALATFYDMKRDKAVESLAALCHAYGEEMNKRELTAVHAAPLVVEMMKAIDRITAAQTRALAHRAAANTAK